MKKIILTGGGGFIGRQALPELLRRGYEVHLADIRTREMAWLPQKVQRHECDLLDPRAQAELFAEVKPSFLLHFAWYAVHGKFWASPENHRWVQASQELLKNFSRNGGKRLVFAGTCAEYDWSYGTCLEGRTPLNPGTLYGKSKHLLQQTFTATCQQNGLSGAWGRIFLLYGPYENPARLVPSVILALLKGERARCTHGRQQRDFMHVEDVANSFVALLDSGVEGPVNIASGQAQPVRQVVETIALKLGRMGLVDFGAVPFPENEPFQLTADVGRLKDEVGFHPKYDLEQGLDQAIEWWKEHGGLPKAGG